MIGLDEAFHNAMNSAAANVTVVSGGFAQVYVIVADLPSSSVAVTE